MEVRYQKLEPGCDPGGPLKILDDFGSTVGVPQTKVIRPHPKPVVLKLLKESIKTTRRSQLSVTHCFSS